MALVDDSFTFGQLQSAVGTARRQQRVRAAEFDVVANAITALAKSNYEFTFSPEQSLAERAIFPYSPSQTNGIEDSRFVQFHEDDGSVHYFATHTAFDGRVRLAPGTQNMRSSTGVEVQVLLPVVQAPFRVYWAYNPQVVRQFLQPPIVADRAMFPNNQTFLKAITAFGQGYPFFEKRSTYRFTIGRTF